jgi:hypothetical protein
MTSANDIGIAWLAVIKVIVVVLLVWGVLYDVVTNILYNIAVASGGDVAVLDMVILFWQWFPVPFLFGVITWAVVVSARIQADTRGL